MSRFEERITIDAPAGKVFDYVSDFTRHNEFLAKLMSRRLSKDIPRNLRNDLEKIKESVQGSAS